jgi:hypothetical protein
MATNERVRYAAPETAHTEHLTHAGYDPELKSYYLTTSPSTKLTTVEPLFKSGYKLQFRTGIKDTALLIKRRSLKS